MHWQSFAAQLEVNRELLWLQTLTAPDNFPWEPDLPCFTPMCFHSLAETWSPLAQPTLAKPSIATPAIAKDFSRTLSFTLLRFRILQCPVRTGMAAPGNGAVRRDHSYGFDRAVGVHGRPGTGLVGERRVAAPQGRPPSVSGASSLCADRTADRSLGRRRPLRTRMGPKHSRKASTVVRRRPTIRHPAFGWLVPWFRGAR